MSLSFVQASPGFILAGTVGYIGYGTFVQKGQVSWKLPALLSATFWGFTLYTFSQEGLLGFWDNHTQNYWGNQVVFDLCFSVALFWLALLPRAKALYMPLAPWYFYVCSTASLGGLHMYARILYLEEKQKNEDSATALLERPTTKNLTHDDKSHSNNSDKKHGYSDEK